MPSVIHQSPKMSARGLSLVAQNVSEQINGLVEVGLQFVTTASARDRVAREFVVDSPPPIWPSSVNREELQGRQLFMAKRSITQEAGLVYINAKYVGGLLRAGAPGYFLSTARESKQSAYTFTEWTYFINITVSPPPTSISTTSADFIPRLASCFYRWINIIHTFEFVVVYNNDAPELPRFKPQQLVSVEATGGLSPYSLRYQADDWFNRPLEPSMTFTQTLRASRDLTLEDAKNFVAKHRIITNEAPQYITPTVRILRRQIFTEPTDQITIPVAGLQDSVVSLVT